MFQATALFFYKFVFFASLIIAESFFMFRLRRKSNFLLRISSSAAVCFAVAFFFPIIYHDVMYISLMFVVFFITTVIAAKMCCDANWQSILFCAISGYSVQHMASVCYNIAITAINPDNVTHIYDRDAVTIINPFQILIFIATYSLMYWVHFRSLRKKMMSHDISIRNTRLLILLVLMALVEIVLNSFTIHMKNEIANNVYFIAASVTNFICSLLLLIILFEIFMNETLEKEMEIVYRMWRQEQKQFFITKETISLINTKCHDMKHQIRSISQRCKIDSVTMREIDEIINIYDSMIKTGNQALDIILAEKSLFCVKNGIVVHCMADGAKLNFMNDTDIYSLFGNMLDNAIQTVIKLERDMRFISLTIKAEGELLSVNSHNYYSGDIRMANGIPITENPDKDYHGFGVMSMVMIVEKYNGNITFEAKDQMFNLNILLPIPTL